MIITRSDVRGRLVMVALAATITIAAILMSLHKLRDFSYPHDLGQSLQAIRALFPQTGCAALRLLIFWVWSGLVLAGLLRRLDPKIEPFDACVAGAAGLWVFGYLAGTLLGPLGLFRGPTVWLLVAIGTVWLRSTIPLREFRRPEFGVTLAIVAVVLAGVSLLPLQLGSPVVPYMDVLAYPASVQRILTFGVYLPFDNDPYGAWGPKPQTPALELFYTLLAIGSHIRLGALAESAAILPMTALIIFATYQLATSLFDDTAGGFAALLLFLTTTFRWVESMRGTLAALALAALGLAFFTNRKQKTSLIAIGAMIIGASVPSHAIDGALTIGVAAVVVITWLLEGDGRRFLAGLIALVGALSLAAPEFFIATMRVVPWYLLALFQISGIAIIIVGVRTLTPLSKEATPTRLLIAARVILLGVLVLIAQQILTPGGSLYDEVRQNYPILSTLGLMGLLSLIIVPPADAPATRLFFLAAALAPALVLAPLNWLVVHISPASANHETYEVSRKIAEHWLPFVLVFPAARFLAMVTNYIPKLAVTTMLMVLLLLPGTYSEDIDYYNHEHSITENWLVDYSILSNGYWTDTDDSRWTWTPHQAALLDLLRREIADGRINTSTHILHIVHDVSPYEAWLRFSVFTGIDDDPVVADPVGPDLGMFLSEGRAKPMSELNQALRARPPYILSEVTLPLGVKYFAR